MISITKEQLDGKPRRVGTLDDKPVFAVRTKGGFNMVCASNGKPLGAGPMMAVARHIAEKAEPKLIWSDLSKGDWIDPTHFEFLLPRYEAVTARMQDVFSRK